MYRSLFSYWLSVSGSQSDRDQFHQRFINHPLTDTSIELTSNTEDESLYEVNSDEGATEEWGYADLVVRDCIKNLPELKVTLDCINEEDHADETVYAWYHGKELSAVTNVSIKSPESLLSELVNQEDTTSESKPYAVYIKPSAVRDVQYAITIDPEPMNDSHWLDYLNAKIFLGVMFAESETAARQKGSEFAGTPIENIGADIIISQP